MFDGFIIFVREIGYKKFVYSGHSLREALKELYSLGVPIDAIKFIF